MVRKYTDKELLDYVQQLPSFEGFPKGRWILGVRSQNEEPNEFDDKFYEFDNTEFIRVLSGTTNPGASILKRGYKKYNTLGAAVVRANKWYYNLWQYGLHKGKMPALLQIGATIDVYRDGNDNEFSEETGTAKAGFYGINFHTNTYDFSKANLKLTMKQIDNWSAGCQVINEREKYVDSMDFYKKAKEIGLQKYITYCLIKEF